MKLVFPQQRLLAIAGLAISVSLVGCGKAKQPWETAHPTTGVLKFEGRPLAGAHITLVPVDKSIPDTVRPRAFTESDGSFELSTYGENDGAPEGKYKVIAMRYPVVGSKENPSNGPNDLPPKYANPDTTDLVAEVSAPETSLKALEIRR
jgi:hypothetical protein